MGRGKDREGQPQQLDLVTSKQVRPSMNDLLRQKSPGIEFSEDLLIEEDKGPLTLYDQQLLLQALDQERD